MTNQYLVKFHVSESRTYMMTITSLATTLKELMTHISVTTELERRKEICKIEFFKQEATHTWERNE
jgi:hypothetical protein